MTPGHHTRLDLLLEHRRPSGDDNVRSVTRRARPPRHRGWASPSLSSFVPVEGRKARAMSGLGKRSLRLLAAGLLAAGCAAAIRAAPPPISPSAPALPASTPPLPRYVEALTLGPRTEWRFHPLVVDLNGDRHLDLVATARLIKRSLHMWLGDGKGAFTPVTPTWTDVGYAALASGDINRDGFPDIVAASHFGGVQTLLSDGRGGFTEKIMRREGGSISPPRAGSFNRSPWATSITTAISIS